MVYDLSSSLTGIRFFARSICMAVRALCLLVLIGVWNGPGYAADVCDPAHFQGAFGFQVSGDTTISGDSKPVVSVGRIVFDGSGTVSGYSSVVFAGLLLGNPVTGTYEVQTDCSISWSLQDDSGSFQHFAGKLTGDGNKVQFRQTDPGGPQRGTLIKTAKDCSAVTLNESYRFSVSGFRIALETGRPAGRVSASGLMTADQNGNLKMTPDRDSLGLTRGTFEMEDDCFIRVKLEPPEMNFRGILVNGGKELLGIQTDPGTAVTLRLTSHEVTN